MIGSIRAFAVLVLVLAGGRSVWADGIKLGAPFSDHMVIQRDRPIRVWGEAAAGGEIEVRVGPRKGKATAGEDGRWEATLEKLPASGPLVVEVVAGGEKKTIENVMIGDVWLCSGQSNMQMPLKECVGGPEAAEAKLPPTLRLCMVGKKASDTPETGAEIQWRIADQESAREFSGVGFFFATALMNDPALKGVSIGVIDSSFGGTTCEGWIPKENLAEFAPGDLRLSMFGIKPSGLYNAMIAPLGKAPVKGVVWYQGASNADRPKTYPKLLGALFASWRDRFETPDLPFIVVQLPDYAAGTNGLSWAWIREAQAAGVRKASHAALSVGINTTDGFDLHPREKKAIGKRAALLAIRDVYGRTIVAEGPIFRDAVPEGDSLRVTFDTAGDGLATRGGGPVRGFAVAGKDGRYLYATTVTINGDSVVLRIDGVPAPRTVRYAWGGAPEANLVNRSGLPAAPFRTDTLSPPDADVQRQPASRLVKMKAYEVGISGNGSVSSLVAGGKQYLSNEPGGAGGTSVPGWLGPRSLADVREPGPGRVSCGDNDVTLTMEFGELGMVWTITNRSMDKIQFRAALHPKVAVDQPGEAALVKLSRGAGTIVVTGVDRVSDSENGKVLETDVDGHASKEIFLNINTK
jgi:sialate O-acetylesterase